MSLGFILGALICAPVFYSLGRIRERDAQVTHEPADIEPALRRSRR